MQVHGVEPDPFCVEYGKAKFPEVALEESRLENYVTPHQFDLVTDFGAIYRSVHPMQMLERYKGLLTPEGVLVIGLGCSTQTLGDANKAIAPDSPSGLWPVTSSHGFVRMIAHPDIFKSMLEVYFEQVDVEWMKQLPYRKNAPFFFARKPRKTPLPFPGASTVQVEESCRFLADYALDESRKAIESFVKKFNPRRVAIYGVTDEGGILEQLLAERGVEVAYRIHPFAPSILAERTEEYFDIGQESPHMLIACKVRPEKKEEVPAIVHVDDSCRVQTVKSSNNSRYRRLIEAFEAETSVPVVLNTSFNVKGQPIVNTPQEALDCYKGTNIDFIVIGDYYAQKA